MAINEDTAHNLGKRLGDALNRHGYGFQYSVIDRARSLYESGLSRWIFQVAEMPVQTEGRDSRIDFILQQTDPRRYLVAECKRVNPAYSDWCFFRAPYLRRNQTGSELFLEEIGVSEAGSLSRGMHKIPNLADEVYHIGIPMKVPKKGDSQGFGRGSAIEEAMSQVCRGLNGLAKFLLDQEGLRQDSTGIRFVPVIFTTARILTSDVDLKETELATGEVNSEELIVTEKSWIWYRYHQSQGLKGSAAPDSLSGDLGDVLDDQFARTIAIVNHSGIDAFLSMSW